MKKLLITTICSLLLIMLVFCGFNKVNYNLCEHYKPKCQKEDKCIIKLNPLALIGCSSRYDTVCNCTKEQYKGQGIIEHYKGK